MDAAKKDPDVDAITIVDVETVVEMTVDADFPTGVTVPVDATFSGSSFFFAHAAETVSDATTDAATEMVTAAGSSLSFCSFAAA